MSDSNDSAKANKRMLGMCILTFLAKKKKIPGTGMSLD